MNKLFTEDPQRSQTYSLEAASLYLDYSKNHLTQDTIDKLLQLAHDRQLPAAIDALLSGEKVNNTEQRPALHSALRFQGQPQSPEEEKKADGHAGSFIRAAEPGKNLWILYFGGLVITFAQGIDS